MNKSMTDHARMVCPAGHTLRWDGRWIHLMPNVVFCSHQDEATFPRYYYKQTQIDSYLGR